MKTLRILGLSTAVVGLATWLDSRSEHRRERRRAHDRIEKTRWEGEGGATPSGAQVSDTPSVEPLHR